MQRIGAPKLQHTQPAQPPQGKNPVGAEENLQPERQPIEGQAVAQSYSEPVNQINWTLEPRHKMDLFMRLQAHKQIHLVARFQSPINLVDRLAVRLRNSLAFNRLALGLQVFLSTDWILALRRLGGLCVLKFWSTNTLHWNTTGRWSTAGR